MTDPKRVHTREQREAAAVDAAHEVSAFYRTLRTRGVPPGAAQALAESYTAALLEREDTPPAPWER